MIHGVPVFICPVRGGSLSQHVGCSRAPPDQAALDQLATDRPTWAEGYTYTLIQLDTSSTEVRFLHHIGVGVPRQTSRGSSFILRGPRSGGRW